jgi:hypothetical protein
MVVGKVEGAVAAQSAALSIAADNILRTPAVEPARFQPLSPAEAVLRYAGDFIPSWAGAISIDLMPAVLVLILCVVHGTIRREGAAEINPASITAAELIAALKLVRDVDAAKLVPTEGGEPLERESLAPAARETDENVTPLVTARAKKD